MNNVHSRDGFYCELLLCLLISYSKFTLPNIIFKLTFYFFQHILTVAKECDEIP